MPRSYCLTVEAGQRQEYAAPILDELKLWFEAQQRRLSSKSTLCKAIQCAHALEGLTCG